jgi:hypothetical protein
MTTKREFIQVNPTNLGNGVFSDRNGLNQIIFEIPQVSKFMKGNTLKVSGTFKIVNGDNVTQPTNYNQFFQVAPAPTNDFYIDGRTGVQSCIETLSIQNLSGATYSTIKSYNRLCASLMPLNESIRSYLNGGVDSIYGGLSKDVSTAKKCDEAFDFAIPLLDGFLMGELIDLQMVKGLRIVITLAPSNYVINNNFWRNSASASGISNGGAFYQLSDIKCSFEASVPDAEGQAAMIKNTNAVMEYNTFSSFYNVIQSTDHNISLNINTGRTLSVIGNIIPSEWVNNYTYGSSKTLQPLSLDGAVLRNRMIVDEMTFTKGGMRKPLDFEIESDTTQRDGIADSFKNWIELNAIRKEWSAGNFEKSLKTELSNPLSNTEPARFDRSRYSICEEDKIQQYNIGVNYDHITENGVNFKGTPLGIRIQTTLPTGQSMKPHSLFLFVKHKNTIVFKDGGVSVFN